MNNNNHTLDSTNTNNTLQPPMGGYMPTLIDKMKEDILKLKTICKQLKDNTNDLGQ